jgi:hypothetical protein
MFSYVSIYVVRYLCNRPWRPIELWGTQAPTFSRQSAYRWRWGCQLYAPAALYATEKLLAFISVRGWVGLRATVRLEGLGRLKNPMTSSGLEAATFRLVAECLNQLRYRVPPYIYIYIYIYTRVYIKPNYITGRLTRFWCMLCFVADIWTQVWTRDLQGIMHNCCPLNSDILQELYSFVLFKKAF